MVASNYSWQVIIGEHWLYYLINAAGKLPYVVDASFAGACGGHVAEGLSREHSLVTLARKAESPGGQK